MAKASKSFTAKAAKQNLGVEVRFESAVKSVQEKIEKVNTISLAKAAFLVMRASQAKIKTSDEPGQKGGPPTTRGRGRKSLRAAIKYFRDNEAKEAYIGPVGSVIGPTGMHHEFGVARKKSYFDERPFMGPSLEESLDRFVGQWRGSLGR